MTYWELDDGAGRAVPVMDRGQLAEAVEKYSAQRDERPFIVQLTGPFGSLGFGVGRALTLLGHTPADGNPPYKKSHGSIPAGEVVVYFSGGHWTEFDSDDQVEWADAKRAILEFFDTGALSSAIRWVEV